MVAVRMKCSKASTKMTDGQYSPVQHARLVSSYLYGKKYMAHDQRHTSQPAALRPTAHDRRPGGPLHSSHPMVQLKIFVSGILQRMFWSVFQNGRRWVLVSLQFPLFQSPAILVSFCCSLLNVRSLLYTFVYLRNLIAQWMWKQYKFEQSLTWNPCYILQVWRIAEHWNN